jgi:hypothetical protein
MTVDPMSVEPCHRCRRTDYHRGPLHDVIDEFSAAKLCMLCVIALLGAAENGGLTVSVVLSRPVAKTATA